MKVYVLLILVTFCYAVQNAIEGEFLRARVKPMKNKDFHLHVNVNCIMVKNVAGIQTGYAVSHEVRFGMQLDGGTRVLFAESNFGSMLIGSLGSAAEQFFIQSIQGDVSIALTEYLKMAID